MDIVLVENNLGIFSKHATTGDGILTSLKIMEAILEQKQPLSKLVEPVKIFPQLLENVPVKNKKETQEDADVIATVKSIEEALGDDGRILVRQSGTEPLVRVMVEAQTDEICAKYVGQVVDVLKEKRHTTN